MTALLLTIPLIAAAPVPKDFDTKTLDGEWAFVGLTLDGKPINGQQGNWVFAGDTVTFHIPNGGQPRVSAIKTDPKAKPRQFEFGDGGMPGVYDIQGDALVICLSQVRVRPTDTAGGPDILRYTFTRAKGK